MLHARHRRRSRCKPRRRFHTIVTVAALAAGLLRSLPIAAHQMQPPDIAVWGPFSSGTFQCLRSIDRAARRCFERVTAVRRGCAEQHLAGESCDQASWVARIAAATRRIAPSVEGACRGGQLTELRFLSLDEARQDLQSACTEQAQLVVGLLYGQAESAAAAGTLDAESRACVDRTAAVSVKHLRLAMALRRRALDRIARQIMTAPEKSALLSTAAESIAAARAAHAQHLQQHCPGFEAFFRRTPTGMLTAIEKRADCLVYASHVQNAVVCSTAQ
jgi:hypothetical protein